MSVHPMVACCAVLLLTSCGRPAGFPAVAPGSPGEPVSTRSVSVGDSKAAAVPRPRAATRQVATPVAGRVVRVVAPPGTEVVAGEPLAWLASPAFDAAASRLRAARADETAALERLRAARASVATAPGAIAATEAAWEAATRRRAALAAELKWIIPSGRVTEDATLYPLRAPEPGTVIASNAAPGGDVAAGGPLFTLAVKVVGGAPDPAPAAAPAVSAVR